MIGTSVDRDTVRTYRLARIHAKRHLSTEDVRNGLKGLAPGDPRRVFDAKGNPLVTNSGLHMKPR